MIMPLGLLSSFRKIWHSGELRWKGILQYFKILILLLRTWLYPQYRKVTITYIVIYVFDDLTAASGEERSKPPEKYLIFGQNKESDKTT